MNLEKKITSLEQRKAKAVQVQQINHSLSAAQISSVAMLLLDIREHPERDRSKMIENFLREQRSKTLPPVDPAKEK
jgi:arginine deiminase